MAELSNLSPQSRVWIYQANEPFEQADLPQIKTYLSQFADQWVSHNRQLKAYADVWHDRFVILMVDETMAGASGCSIDSSVHFLQGLQSQYQRDLFDRMRFSFKQGEEVVTLSRDEFAAAYAKGEINDETPVFDTLVKDKAGLESDFVKPLKDSWHARMV